MTLAIGPLFWVVLTTLILSYLARRVHFFLANIFYILTRSGELATFWSGIIVWPGTVIHELAHALFAFLLLIPISAISVMPDFRKGTLGYVRPNPPRRYYPVRHSLIGVAPFFVGIAAVWGISYLVFNADIVNDPAILSTPEAIGIAIQRISQTENPWIWLYLLFAIGNSIFPSKPDRSQWGLMGLILLVVLAGLLYFGLTEFVFQPMIGVFNTVAGYLMLAFAMTIVIDIVVLPILWFIFTILDSVIGPPG